MENKKSRTTTQEVVITGLSIALVFVATAFINIRLPFGYGGLIHLGNVPLFLIAIIFGKKVGAIAGAFGMAMFDVMCGWLAWAPGTFIIVGLMGYAVGWIAEHKNDLTGYILAMVVACMLKIGGYYIVEGLIYGNWIQPVASIPGNLIQIGVAAVIALPIAGILKKALHQEVAAVR